MKKEEREQYIKHRIKTAYKTLEASEILIENNFISSSVNRLYYSVFYIVNALLVKNEISARTHNEIKQQFSQHFIKTKILNEKYGILLAKLFVLRQKADYDNFFTITKEEVVSLIDPVKEMIKEIEKLINNS